MVSRDDELVEATDSGTELPSTDPSLSADVQRQDDEAMEFAASFLKKVIRLRGVRIDRAAFLRQELRKIGLSEATIEAAVASTPVQAGISLVELDVLAGSAIGFETNKAAALSFGAGLPGGFAIFATVPADITQYYVHAFRVMQKLAYFYGWQNFIEDLDEVDDETLGKLTLFLGVMMGVGGASSSLTRFATQVARPAIQKQITQKALTKTAWYPVVKQTLKMIGIKVTKDSFAKTVTKVVPVASGVISGGMTLISLRTQAGRLKEHLRQLPPPGVDAAEYRERVAAADIVEAESPSRIEAVRESIDAATSSAVSGAASTAKNAWGSANRAGGAAAKRGRALVSKVRRQNADAPAVAESDSASAADDEPTSTN